MLPNTAKLSHTLEKKLHVVASLCFLLGIVITVSFTSMVIFFFSDSLDDDPGQKMLHGMIPGMVFFYVICPAGILGAIVAYQKLKQLRVKLNVSGK